MKGMININTQLHDYQEQASEFAINHPKCGLFLELGLGKTLIALAVLEKLYDKETGHILIIAPKSIARATWVNEIKKWDIKIPYKSLIVTEKGTNLSRKKRLEAYAEILENPVRTIYFINRELLADLVENSVVINNQLIWAFQTIVIDELQSFKSCASGRFKAIKKIMPAVNRFIGLTGTPAPNGIEDLWSQIFLMDEGARLGKNITAFRREYMMPGFTNQKGQVCSWIPKYNAEPVIYNKIADIAISMKNTNLVLPSIMFINDMVYMSNAERKIYKNFVDNALLEFDSGDVATASNIAVMHNKLQQLASGAIYTVDEDDNPTGRYETIHKQKLERLEYIRENNDGNLLVAYYFKSDADMIKKHFDKLKIPCEIFDSAKADMFVKRWDNGEIKMMLIQPASAGFGLNLQYGGNTLIWYTLSYNLEHYLQTIGRVYRQGQTKPVYIHHIMTDKTIDTKVLKSLKEKDATMKQLLDALEYAPNKTTNLQTFTKALSDVTGRKNMTITNEDRLQIIREIKNET